MFLQREFRCRTLPELALWSVFMASIASCQTSEPEKSHACVDHENPYESDVSGVALHDRSYISQLCPFENPEKDEARLSRNAQNDNVFNHDYTLINYRAIRETGKVFLYENTHSDYNFDIDWGASDDFTKAYNEVVAQTKREIDRRPRLQIIIASLEKNGYVGITPHQLAIWERDVSEIINEAINNVPAFEKFRSGLPDSGFIYPRDYLNEISPDVDTGNLLRETFGRLWPDENSTDHYQYVMNCALFNIIGGTVLDSVSEHYLKDLSPSYFFAGVHAHWPFKKSGVGHHGITLSVNKDGGIRSVMDYTIDSDDSKLLYRIPQDSDLTLEEFVIDGVPVLLKNTDVAFGIPHVSYEDFQEALAQRDAQFGRTRARINDADVPTTYQIEDGMMHEHR